MLITLRPDDLGGNLFVPLSFPHDEYQTIRWSPISRPRSGLVDLDSVSGYFLKTEDPYVQRRRVNTATRIPQSDKDTLSGGLFVMQPPADEFRVVQQSPITRIRPSQTTKDTDSTWPSSSGPNTILIWGDSPFYREATYVLGMFGAGAGRGLFKTALSATAKTQAAAIQTANLFIVRSVAGAKEQFLIEVPGKWQPVWRAVISQKTNVTRTKMIVGLTASALTTNTLNKLVIGGSTTQNPLGTRAGTSVGLTLVAQKVAQQIPITTTISPLPVATINIKKKISMTLSVP